jgi:putative peptide zinc metalloprotease protein
MSRVPERVYADRSCEILLSGSKATILDKSSNRYYQTEVDSLPREIVSAATIRTSRVSWAQATLFVAVLVLLLISNVICAYSAPYGPVGALAVSILISYLLLSIVIHEFAHVFALRVMGRAIDGVGFKLNYWVFPAIYVRMNQSLLLSRCEKIFVHGAGLAVNLAINFLLVLLNQTLIKSSVLCMALQFVALTLAVNAVPALKSDGYRILLALAGVDDVRGFRRNAMWVNIIKILSISYAVGYAAFMLISIISRIWQ